ncbi:hypothetical protein [Antarcticimicrobium luteum]|uniref:PA14 domain-containing protein n=1 Tax=Antarcticimicrobium luteum TaxID=2547397 RepID=A0A4R5UTD1_9RHOB|nr:hypothetical protein [Antarcticimicrobium luteum]TDK42392.1 hypothetical protein E1832_19860 [Antarcticimicrobium luteum]
MKSSIHAAVSAFALLVATASATWSAPLTLTPANPQPGGVSGGLSVSYGYAPDGQDIRNLADAGAVLRKGAQRGPALRGLDYADSDPGAPTLTSQRDENVAASITGYIRFDAPGVYEVDFYTNDGLDARIGGQRVGFFDGRQACDSTYVTEVEVPQAGWYSFEATYFNRLNTSCLMMRWGKKGKQLKWVPNGAFGHK